ncbi:MAG: Asp-tRNA(Asn)/Glu-tRNA(Gln) amidotransferase subunit GatB [Gemmatimonadaceae bacterium]|nr:Asp-tRNA(Asn)/Glu-tRNA(Gln) amidotransferase subunit GatB [Gemmatimonadaceae bacterium]
MSTTSTTATVATASPTDFELVVGLEVHCQLATATKIFCRCSTSFGDTPNRNTCPVCLGLPGALPVMNAHAVELATQAALALGCTVHGTSVFARKNYFYPDLPKGYQISQFDQPLATGGVIDVGPDADGMPRPIGITRVHMEEDAGKSVHDRFEGWTAIDLNRTGTPLVEIVSEPDLRSAQDAGSYLRQLKQILEFTAVSDANMEEGSLRVDVNISVRPRGTTALGTKTEIKNLNTFSGVERSIEIEFARQCAVLASGGAIVQQTMLWDGARNEIRPARSKEGSHDYRYFPDPDLPPLVLDDAFIAAQRRALPELPRVRRDRFQERYALTGIEADQLVAERALADYFEAVAVASGDPKRSANWVLGVVLAAINARGAHITAPPVSAARVAELIRLDADGVVSNTAARQLFAMLLETDADPRVLAEQHGLLKISDDAPLLAWIDEVFAAFPTEAQRFLAGEQKLQGVLVGHVMRQSKGAADPKRVNQLLSARVP